MIYTARTGTKVKLAANIKWDNQLEADYYAPRIAQLGDKVWKVKISQGDSVGIYVKDYDLQVIPKKALDYAAR